MKKRPPATKNQRRALRYALKYPYNILAMDPRLGKSRVAIRVREKLKLNCVVICPSYLVTNWVKEINKWTKKKRDITAITKGSQIYEVCDTDYVIVSFDLAQKAVNFFEWADLVIIDEGHNLKSMEAKRTQFIHKNVYENSVKRLIILTGTPLKNRVKEFYSLMALMHYDPRLKDNEFLDRFPTEVDFADYFSHRKKYTIEINGKYVTIVKWRGLKNLPELKGYLRGRYLRIKASEKDLPPVYWESILVSDTPDKELLKAFESYFMDEEAGSVMSDKKAEAALKKVPFTIKYVEDLLENVKCCLVYSDHIAPAEQIAKHFGVKAITGKVPAKRRSQMAKDFQSGKGKILVATVGALKEGQDLYRSNDIVLNDYPWVPGDLKQVVNRIRRMGDKNPCIVHRILGSPQDEKIIDALTEKMRVIEMAT